jgi:cytoskeletal protein RodZ
MPETIGQQLKQARERRSLTIQKVVEATRIRAHQIEAIEADDFESLPSPVQTRAFLRIYSEFLGLSLAELIERQRAGAGPVSPDVGEAPAAAEAVEPAPAAPKAPAAPEEASEPTPDAAAAQESPPRRKRFALPSLPLLRRKTPAGATAAQPETSEADLAEPEQAAEAVEAVPSPAEAPPAEPAPPARSQVIFDSIGESLRVRREALSLTLDEVERHTRVRKHYLQALEGGSFDRLPSSVQGRGMLSSYALFINLDVDAVLLQYAEALQAQLIERQPKPAEKPARKPLQLPFQIKLPRLKLPPVVRRYLSMDVLVGGGLVILLLAFAIWGAGRIIGANSTAAPQQTAPPISDVLIADPGGTASSPLPTASPGGGPSLPAANPTAAVTLPAGGGGAIEILLIALDQAWVRVTVDGTVAFEGRLVAGTAYPFGGDQQIEVLTGDGSAVGVLYNQSDLGPMGTYGEVVHRIYTVNTILVPTPAAAATLTPSPAPTQTPAPTANPGALDD